MKPSVRKRITKILSCVCLSVFVFGELYSQQKIAFKHVTVQNGLSQSSVTCIFQDRKGFIWFGTQDGLNRFDGYEFKIFRNIANDSSSLSDNFIFSIYEDDTGVLWIETQSRKLHQYVPKQESFLVVEKEKINTAGLKVSTVDARLQELNGVVWKGGLGSPTGLQRTDTKTGKVTIFKHDPTDPSSLSDNKVYSIFRDHSGNLWIGTFNGLDMLDERSGKFCHYRNDPHNPNSLPDNWVWPIYEDSRGNLLIGTVRGGLSIFDPRTNTYKNYKNNPADPASINNNYIYSIYEDRSGIIWIGTNLGGVNYYYPPANTIEFYNKDVKLKNSLSDNHVASMMVDRKGVYWIGTGSGGLNKFDYTKKVFSRLVNTPGKSNSLISNSVQSLLEDKDGIVWIGTFSSGLDAYDPKSGKFTHYTQNPAQADALTDNRIYSLTEDKSGNIWIGTYGGGVNKFDKKTSRFSNYQFDAKDSASLSSNSAWSIAFDDLDNLWIGTFGGGVNFLAQNSRSFKHFKNIPHVATSIIDNSIIRVFKDSKGTMWFGTTKGFSRFIPGSNSFKNYTEKEGLANNFVYGIVEDNDGKLWFSTNNGLSKFDPVKETFTNYYSDDGLQSNEFNQNAFAKDRRTGNILFGGPNGFNVFNPDKLKGNDYIPPIAFTGFLRYNSDDQDGKPIVEKGITELDSVSLTYKDNILSFDFAALSFYNNHKNQYKYRLEDINENWIQLGHNHAITFTNLPPGEYTLHITGSNNDGVWNPDGTSVLLFVSPPWWKTNIAYSMYALIFVSILLGIRKFESDQREQKAKIRETELRMKTAVAEKRVIQIENDRKTKELEEARLLQLSMLPKELPVLPHLEIAAFMRTATEVGGDYYDFIVQEDGVLNVAFGDATGHGLQAGTMVTLMKGFFTSDSARLGQQEFMNHCTQMIKEIKLGRILMSFSFLRVHNGAMSITSAGMPPVYLFHGKAKETEEILMKGMPLGAKKNFPYSLIEKNISSGDTILLVSDGLPEQMNDKEEMFDYARVKDIFTTLASEDPNAIIKKLIEAGDNWMNGRVQDDDISLVVIKVK